MCAVVDVLRHIAHEVLRRRHGSSHKVHELPSLKTSPYAIAMTCEPITRAERFSRAHKVCEAW
eukprot:3082245-Pyramimonas_sp.AAC.1